MEVVYSEIAISSLQEIIDFLKINWTQKEINTMNLDIEKFVQTVNDGIIKHQNFEGFANTKFVLIGKKQVKLIYRVENSDRISIALFWHCKQNPQKLKKLLK